MSQLLWLCVVTVVWLPIMRSLTACCPVVSCVFQPAVYVIRHTAPHLRFTPYTASCCLFTCLNPHRRARCTTDQPTSLTVTASQAARCHTLLSVSISTNVSTFTCLWFHRFRNFALVPPSNQRGVILAPCPIKDPQVPTPPMPLPTVLFTYPPGLDLP